MTGRPAGIGGDPGEGHDGDDDARQGGGNGGRPVARAAAARGPGAGHAASSGTRRAWPGRRRRAHRAIDAAIGLSLAGLVAGTGLALGALLAPARAPAADGAPVLDFLGMAEIPPGTRFGSTVIGGLSGAVAAPDGAGVLAVSDDRDAGADGTPRLYRLAVDLADGSLDAGDLAVLAMYPLKTADGATLDVLRPDPEAVARDGAGRLWIASERDAEGRPAIMAFEDFSLVATLPVPEDHMPGAGRGVRDNKGFESLAIGPDGVTLWAAHESALVQDGPEATLGAGTRVRVLRYALGPGTGAGSHGRLEAEYLYPVEPIANAPRPADGYADSGLVELFALDDGTLLALERSFSVRAPGRGYTVRLFHVDPAGATPIGAGGAAAAAPMAKTLLLDFAETGIAPDNLEAIARGPRLADGRETLLVISDDNFARFGRQTTQVYAFAID